MVDTSFIIYLFIQAYWGEICSSFCAKTSNLQSFLERSHDISHDLHLYRKHLIERADYN
ncbi:MAG: hypothetical protein V7K98_27880 [Nostoc sp.]|uniref:hypothetical protein n=1 Tax=Nostoc sp. TaxID=1180 RepID=UPI002FF4D26A